MKVPPVAPAVLQLAKRPQLRQSHEGPVILVRASPTGFRFWGSPLTSWMVTGPVALVQARVKGWPATTSKLVLVKSALALTTAARAPTMARIENFILIVGLEKSAIVLEYGNDGDLVSGGEVSDGFARRGQAGPCESWGETQKKGGNQARRRPGLKEGRVTYEVGKYF